MNTQQFKNYLLAHKNENVDSLIYEKQVNYFTDLFNGLEEKTFNNLTFRFWDEIDSIREKLNEKSPFYFKNMSVYISELFHCEEEEKDGYYLAFKNIEEITDNLREKENEKKKYLNVVEKIKNDIKREEEKKEEAATIQEFIKNYGGEIYQKGWREGQNIKNITIKIKDRDVNFIVLKNYHIYYGTNPSNGEYRTGDFSFIYHSGDRSDRFTTDNEILTNEEIINFYQNRINNYDKWINKYEEDLKNIKTVYNQIQKLSIKFKDTLNIINSQEAREEMLELNKMKL